MSIEHYDIDVGGELRLHVASSGSGQPLLLLHGFTGSWETWEPLRPLLEKSRRVLALDLPGHGRSSSPADALRYGLRRLADDIVRVLDRLSIGRADVLGYSMGGRAALHFAAAHPDRVGKIVLESASAGVSDPVLCEERLRADAELARFVEGEGISAFVDRWESLPLWESQQALDESTRAELRAQRMRNNPQGLARSLLGAGAATEPLGDHELAGIEAPTLALAGALDRKYVDIATRLENALTNARTATIPDAGHAIHLERPAVFAAEVLGFLEDRPFKQRDAGHV